LTNTAADAAGDPDEKEDGAAGAVEAEAEDDSMGTQGNDAEAEEEAAAEARPHAVFSC